MDARGHEHAQVVGADAHRTPVRAAAQDERVRGVGVDVVAAGEGSGVLAYQIRVRLHRRGV